MAETVPHWKRVLAHLVGNAEEHFDALKYRLSDKIGHKRAIMIRPYRGFGTQDKFYIKGRVLEDQGISPPEDNDSLWENLVNMYKRFESDEVPHARLRARYGQAEQELVCDEEGYFEAWLEPGRPVPTDELWQQVDLELLEPLRPGLPTVTAEAQVFVPPPGAKFGVISDIDDTVLQTNAVHLLRMARTVFLGNARTRLPFKGVGAFYRALFHGASGDDRNPLFYVSSSPWNLYGLLSDFFHLQDIPIGPILILRDWGVSEEQLLNLGHRQHKLEAIRRVMDVFTGLPFILLGDSGQEDPEIYTEVVEQYPNRIQAVYIRNVSANPLRSEAIQKLAERVRQDGSTLILADDTLPMAKHASEQGWIAAAELPAIEVEKQADEIKSELEKLLLGEDE